MHYLAATWRGVTHATPEEAASPGATHQPHVPRKVALPRLPRQRHRKRREAEAEGGGRGGKFKGQQTGVR